MDKYQYGKNVYLNCGKHIDAIDDYEDDVQILYIKIQMVH